MKKIFPYSLMLFILFALSACNKQDKFGNAVYLTDASASNDISVTVDQSNVDYNLTARTATKINGDLTVDIGVKESLIDDYNKKNGTDYKLLPADYYTLTNNNVSINAGSVLSSPAKISIKPLNGLDDANKYVIPVCITNVQGGIPLLDASKYLIVKVNKVITTSVPHFDYITASVTYPKEFLNIKIWTLEWRVKMASLDRSNQSMIYSGGTNSEVYTRFGDVVIEPTQLQVKFGSKGQFSPAKEFQAGVWYQMALVFDGSTAKWYVNGNLELNVPVSGDFSFSGLGMGSTGSDFLANEVRFWSTARSQSQIISNMYAVDPKTAGLEAYWKCNEGSGTLLKDATGHGYDMTFKSTPTWIEDVKMPDITNN